ncbi:MAG: AEC family transporter [Clostridia bacterium]|nr:AEC family transporter [Clostridia bacterium]
MDYFTPIFNQMLVLIILIVIGVILARKKIVPDNSAKLLSKLENVLFVPALVLGTFIDNCTVEILSGVWQLLVISFAMAFLLIPISKWIAKRFVKEEFMQKLAGYGLMFSNFGFMGNAIFLSVFPDIFFEYTLFTLPFWSMAYVWAVPTILIPKENQETNPTFWTRIKPFFNPMLIAVFIGFFIGITGLGSYMPAPVTQVIDSASACMTPVAMILTGITVGNIDVKAMLKKGYLYAITAIRLLVYPLAFLGIIALLNLLPHNAFINATVFKCILCVAAMPMGLTSIFVPAAYGKDVSEAAGLVLFTHVFSVATIPLMFMCLQWIIG